MKRHLLLVATLGLGAALAMPAAAQNWQRYPDSPRWGWDNTYRDRDDRRAYEAGYRDGDHDRDHHKRWHPRGGKWRGDDRRAYEEGYRAGYNGGNWGRDRDWNRDHGYRR